MRTITLLYCLLISVTTLCAQQSPTKTYYHYNPLAAMLVEQSGEVRAYPGTFYSDGDAYFPALRVNDNSPVGSLDIINEAPYTTLSYCFDQSTNNFYLLETDQFNCDVAVFDQLILRRISSLDFNDKEQWPVSLEISGFPFISIAVNDDKIAILTQNERGSNGMLYQSTLDALTSFSSDELEDWWNPMRFPSRLAAFSDGFIVAGKETVVTYPGATNLDIIPDKNVYGLQAQRNSGNDLALVYQDGNISRFDNAGSPVLPALQGIDLASLRSFVANRNVPEYIALLQQNGEEFFRHVRVGNQATLLLQETSANTERPACFTDFASYPSANSTGMNHFAEYRYEDQGSFVVQASEENGITLIDQQSINIEAASIIAKQGNATTPFSTELTLSITNQSQDTIRTLDIELEEYVIYCTVRNPYTYFNLAIPPGATQQLAPVELGYTGLNQQTTTTVNLKVKAANNKPVQGSADPNQAGYSIDITPMFSSSVKRIVQEVSVWPNPATDQIELNSGQLTEAFAIDVLGKRYPLSVTSTSISVTQLPKGFYRLNMRDAVLGEVWSTFIKQ